MEGFNNVEWLFNTLVIPQVGWVMALTNRVARLTKKPVGKVIHKRTTAESPESQKSSAAAKSTCPFCDRLNLYSEALGTLLQQNGASYSKV